MSELGKRSDISRKVDTDKKEVDKETKRAEGVVDDAGHVDATDKKVELKGTEEGAKEITKSVSKAMDVTKDVHKKLDDEQNKRFGEIKNVEKNFSDRADSTKKDMQSINQELGKMKSKDTGEAKSDMKSAAQSAEGDTRFLKDSESKEKDTRTQGEREMKGQTSKIKGFKVKRG